MALIVGVPACAKWIDDVVMHATPARYGEAASRVFGALPVLVPPAGPGQLAILDRLDGLLVSGSPSNVHPSHYQGGESQTPELHDPHRDSTTLPLLREAIRRGLPVLAICRGIQELNVALGGSLHQRVHTLDHRLDHRSGPGSIEAQFGPKHIVAVSGWLARVIGGTQLTVNSLHGQAIDRLAPGLVVEAVAPDGTIEAVRLEGARGFVLGIQWHPEWNWATERASRAIFTAFGEACSAYAAGLRAAA
jgi:putative glutamine amidotransferase